MDTEDTRRSFAKGHRAALSIDPEFAATPSQGRMDEKRCGPLDVSEVCRSLRGGRFGQKIRHGRRDGLGEGFASR